MYQATSSKTGTYVGNTYYMSPTFDLYSEFVNSARNDYPEANAFLKRTCMCCSYLILLVICRTLLLNYAK